MRFKITVPPQQLNSKILQTQLHKGREKQSHTKENLKFRDRTAKRKDHVTQETMKYIKIISIWRERHDNTQEIRPISPSDDSQDSQGVVNKLKTGNTNAPSCYRCGGKHAAPKCRFKSAKCYKCSKVGHLASVCRSNVVESSVKSKQQESEGNVHNVLESSEACMW